MINSRGPQITLITRPLISKRPGLETPVHLGFVRQYKVPDVGTSSNMIKYLKVLPSVLVTDQSRAVRL